MSNVLSKEKKQQVIALGKLGWTLRRIEQTTGVRRETAGAYLKAAGIAVRTPGGWGRRSAKPANAVITDSADSKPANEAGVTTDFIRPFSEKPPLRLREPNPSASVCEPYRETIELGLSRGRNAMAIWQDMVTGYGFSGGYQTVQRFVRKLRGSQGPEPVGIIVTAPGEECQVDYGTGPMVRDAQNGKYRRTRLFVMTLGYSRKAVRLLVFGSSSRAWAELHEMAFRRLGGSCRVLILDNLKEGVLKPDIYDPTLNPLFKDVLEHYRVVAMPCCVRDPDRKGKVESAVAYAKKTPLKGMRFESLEEAQAYLDQWESRWADTRIHGTTKRQVAAMFAEEKPFLLPLPLEPFRYYQYGERTVHLDGCVEVDAAYYSVPPGWIGKLVKVQWDSLHVRILDPRTHQLLREHVRQERGRHRIRPEDNPKKTPFTTAQLLARAARAGSHIGAFCDAIHRHQGEAGIRRILGVLALAKKFGVTAVEDACAAALELRVYEYRFIRRYLERRPPLTLRQVDPLIRQPRYIAISSTQKSRSKTMNPIELQCALRQLRLGGMAAVLETRLHQAQTERMAPIDLIACLVSDELNRRSDRLLERRRKAAEFRDPQKTLDNFDFNFNKKMNRSLVFDLATANFIAKHEDSLFLGPPGTGKSHLAQAIGQAAIQQGYRVLYREAHTLINDLADAALDGTRKEQMELFSTVPLLIIDDLGMRKLPATAAEDLLEIVMRRYERTSTLLTSNRPIDDWGKLLGDTAAVTAMLDRLLHHGHVLKCGPRSWRTKTQLPSDEKDEK